MVDWLQPTEGQGEDMDTLGREREPRTFNPLVVAKALAWLGAAVLVFGTAGVIYLITRTTTTTSGGGFPSITVGFSSTEARVSAALTMEPSVIVATAALWLVAAFLWSRGSAAR